MSEIEDNMAAVTRVPCNSYQNLVTDLRIDLENLEPLLSEECCIYRVPSNLRRVNEAAYTPQFVSLGPLHYGDRNLKKMEKHKLTYLEIFLKRAEERAKSLEDFVRYVKENEQRIRRCYAETFDHLNSDQFARMILVDASFIIVHIRRTIDEIEDAHKLIFDIPVIADSASKDLLLLENQLPFFVLEGLWGMVFEDDPFSKVQEFFAYFNHQEKRMTKDFKHFTDLMKYYQLPAEEEEEQTQAPTVPTHSRRFSDCSSRFSKVLQTFQALLGVGFHVVSLLLCQKTRDDVEGNFYLLYTASELHEAGVTFKKVDSKCFLDIKFADKGVLEMPCFAIYDGTEALIRNVMALEQCHNPDESHVCDYFVLMDGLISTDKDVDLLVGNKILVNRLGSNQAVASLVNKLGSEIIHNPKQSRYSKTIGDLNAYYEVRCHKWIAALRHVYFKTPWRSASTIAAIILLLLTLAQTIRSFLSP